MIDWDAIVRDEGPAVWRTAQRLLAHHADAEECFQDTFAAAVELTRRSRAPVSHWRALLVRLATARAVDRLRRRVSQRSHEVADANVAALPDRHDGSLPPERAQQAELSAHLREALVHLPPKQADAFCLHCLEGFSYREVAEQMNESVDHVGVLLHRARAALREQVATLLPEATAGAVDSRSTRSLIQEVSDEP